MPLRGVPRAVSELDRTPTPPGGDQGLPPRLEHFLPGPVRYTLTPMDMTMPDGGRVFGFVFDTATARCVGYMTESDLLGMAEAIHAQLGALPAKIVPADLEDLKHLRDARPFE